MLITTPNASRSHWNLQNQHAQSSKIPKMKWRKFRTRISILVSYYNHWIFSWKVLRSRIIFSCNTKYHTDYHFHLGDGGQIENIVLVQPQSVKLKIRPGSSQGVKFKIGQSPEYPLDLYFLLDLSWSMENTTKTVAEKGLCLTIKKKFNDDL